MYRCLAIHLHQAASDPPSPEDVAKNGALVDVTGNQHQSLFFWNIFPVLRMWNPHEFMFSFPDFLRWFSTGTLGPKLWEYINHLSLFGFYHVFTPFWCPLLQQLDCCFPRSRRNLHELKLPKKQRKVRIAGLEIFVAKVFKHLWHLCDQNRFWSGIMFFFQRGASRCVWTLNL